MLFSQRCFPDFESRQSVVSFLASGATPVTNICPFQITGHERPGGSATFHNKLLASLNPIGGFSLSATPSPCGPRNPGQLPACAADSQAIQQTRQSIDKNLLVACRPLIDTA